MLQFLKLYNVKDPQREIGNAGIDFFIPEMSEKFAQNFYKLNENTEAKLEIAENEDGSIQRYVIIKPNGNVLIPSGLCSLMPIDDGLLLCNKSSIATKLRLDLGAKLIDHSYEGEIVFHLENRTSRYRILDLGMKIVQGIPIKIDIDEIKVVNDVPKEKFYEEHMKTRLDGKFGSTGA